MRRRNFILTSLMALCAGFFSWGCNAIADLQAYIPVGINALNGVVIVLQAAGIAVPALTPILALFSTLLAAISEYNNAPATDKVTLKQKLSLVLRDIIDQIGAFFADLNIPGGSLLALITGLISVILSTLAGFATQLPAPVAPARLAMVSRQSVTVTPEIISLKTFKKRWNALALQYQHPEIVLH
jgi:hypothetical protein